MADPAAPKPPARPPIQAKAPGRKRPRPHMRHDHAKAMRRPNEPVMTAKHSLNPHHPVKP